MIYRYAYPENFMDWEKPDFNQIKEPIVLWGAGKIGGAADHCLKKRGVEYAAFCDVAKDKWGTRFCGHEVISPDELQKRYPTAVVLITSSFYDGIYSMARERGYTEIYDCHSLFMEIDFSGYDFFATREFMIRSIENYLSNILAQKVPDSSIDEICLDITTECSLRCRDCAAFIPYVASPRHYPAKEIMAGLNKVLDSIQHIENVLFCGGEPLLHPELAGMIRGLKDDKRIDRISIVTNGTILPSEDALRAMGDEKRLYVRISDYGALSGKKDELVKALEQYGVRYEVTNYDFWTRPARLGRTDESEDQLAAKFRLCTMRSGPRLCNGKLYLCTVGSAGCGIGAFPDSADNYLDLLDDRNFTQRLNSFLKRRNTDEYMDACRYCSGAYFLHFEEKVPVAVQTEEVMTFPPLKERTGGKESDNG